MAARSTKKRESERDSKRDLKRDPTAGIRLDGKALHCAKCSNGHRANSCKHYDKPLFFSNRAGRPSGISKSKKEPGKKLKCDCPKSCDCQDVCMCKPKCHCTARAYIVAYLYDKDEDEAQPPPFEDMKGRFYKLGEVWTNSAGETISEEKALELETTKAQLLKRENNKKQSTLLTPESLNMSDIPPEVPLAPRMASYPTPRNTPMNNFSPQPYPYPQPQLGLQPNLPGRLEPALTSDWMPVQPSWPSTYNGVTIVPNNQIISYTSPVPAPMMLNNVYPHPNPYIYPTNNMAQNQILPTKPCPCVDTCRCAFCPQHSTNQDTQAAVGDFENYVIQNPSPTTFRSGPEYTNCVYNSRLAHLGDLYSPQAAALMAGQRASPKVRSMMLFQQQNGNQFSGPAQYARNGADWNYIQPYGDILEEEPSFGQANFPVSMATNQENTDGLMQNNNGTNWTSVQSAEEAPAQGEEPLNFTDAEMRAFSASSLDALFAGDVGNLLTDASGPPVNGILESPVDNVMSPPLENAMKSLIDEIPDIPDNNEFLTLFHETVAS